MTKQVLASEGLEANGQVLCLAQLRTLLLHLLESRDLRISVRTAEMIVTRLMQLLCARSGYAQEDIARYDISVYNCRVQQSSAA